MLAWLRNYRGEWIRADVTAGLIAAAVVIPKAMAYGTVAGLPVQVGLYTAFVPMAIYALHGTSRPLSVSTTATLASLSGAALGQVAPHTGSEGLMTATATLTMLVGGLLVLGALLRLGFVSNFISEPVLIGFKAAIALLSYSTTAREARGEKPIGKPKRRKSILLYAFRASRTSS